MFSPFLELLLLLLRLYSTFTAALTAHAANTVTTVTSASFLLISLRLSLKLLFSDRILSFCRCFCHYCHSFLFLLPLFVSLTPFRHIRFYRHCICHFCHSFVFSYTAISDNSSPSATVPLSTTHVLRFFFNCSRLCNSYHIYVFSASPTVSVTTVMSSYSHMAMCCCFLPFPCQLSHSFSCHFRDISSAAVASVTNATPLSFPLLQSV